MTVLRSPISAHTTVVPVDAPLSSPSYPIFYDLDAETIKVTDGADTTEWQVERGVANTQQAKHAKSVRLVANASPYGGSGGGVNVDNGTDPPAAVTTLVAPGADVSVPGEATLPLALRQLGPFGIDFDTANLYGAINGGVVLSTLPTGALVLEAVAFVTTRWNSTQGAKLYVSVGANSIGATADIIANAGLENADIPNGTFHKDVKWGAGTDPQIVRALAGAKLICWSDLDSPGGDAPTAGHLNIYAIIAVPAS